MEIFYILNMCWESLFTDSYDDEKNNYWFVSPYYQCMIIDYILFGDMFYFGELNLYIYRLAGQKLYILTQIILTENRYF